MLVGKLKQKIEDFIQFRIEELLTIGLIYSPKRMNFHSHSDLINHIQKLLTKIISGELDFKEFVLNKPETYKPIFEFAGHTDTAFSLWGICNKWPNSFRKYYNFKKGNIYLKDYDIWGDEYYTQEEKESPDFEKNLISAISSHAKLFAFEKIAEISLLPSEEVKVNLKSHGKII